MEFENKLVRDWTLAEAKNTVKSIIAVKLIALVKDVS